MCLRSIFIFLELEVTHVFTDSGKAYKEINKILSSYDWLTGMMWCLKLENTLTKF